MLRLRLIQPSSLAPNRRSNSRCGISSGGSGRLGPAQLMFFCIAPPNDSCDTPICSERKRELSPIFAREHLIDRRAAGSAAGERRAGHQRAHRVRMAVAAVSTDAALSRPLRTCTSSRNRASGERHGVMS